MMQASVNDDQGGPHGNATTRAGETFPVITGRDMSRRNRRGAAWTGQNCRQHNLSYPTLTYWQRKLGKPSSSGPALVPVPVDTPSTRVRPGGRSENHPEHHCRHRGQRTVLTAVPSAGTLGTGAAIMFDPATPARVYIAPGRYRYAQGHQRAVLAGDRPARA